MACGNHLRPREPAPCHQAVDIQSYQQGQQEENPAGVGGEGPWRQTESPHIRHIVNQRPRTLRSFFIEPPRQPEEPFLPQDLLDGRYAQRVFPGSLEFIPNVVYREVLFPQRDDAAPNRVLSGL
jgi:hypothetical protein